MAALTFGAGAIAKQSVTRDDLASVFEELGVVGTFVTFDEKPGYFVTVHGARAEQPYIPASTFKIPNTLIAFETGVVKSPEEVFRYDGKPRAVKAWERDMTLREAMTTSNVPVYQEIARRIGAAQYVTWLDRLEYGNRQIGGQIDEFWLKGPLEITASAQTFFLFIIARGQHRASARSQAMVRDMIRLEAKGSRLLFGKTGWDGRIGWWVGWVEDGSRVTPFALNIDMPSVDMAPKRIALGKELLARLGVY